MVGSRGCSISRERRMPSSLKNAEATVQEGKDFQIFEDEISKLRVLNQHLVEELKSSREEKASLSATSVKNERVLVQCQAETNELESELNKFMARAKELNEKTEEDHCLWDAEKRNLEGTFAEMQTKLEMMVTARGLVCRKIGDLNGEMESLKAQLNECIADLACMENEKDQYERTLHQCRTEKIDLESELNESKGRSQESLRKFEEGYSLWEVEKSNLQCNAEELETKIDLMNSERESLSKKNAELDTEAESLKSQLNELKLELNESMARSDELLENLDENSYLWSTENRKLEDIYGNVETDLESMASERAALKQRNSELTTEVELCKAQLIEYNIALVCWDDERQVLKAVSSSNARRLEALMIENAAKENKISCLQKQLNEAVKQHSDSIQQRELSENSLKQQNEMLQKELDSTRCLLQVQKSNEEFDVESSRVDKQSYELNKTFCGDLWNWPKFMLKLVILCPFRIARWMILLPFALFSLVLEICNFLMSKVL